MCLVLQIIIVAKFIDKALWLIFVPLINTELFVDIDYIILSVRFSHTIRFG